MASVTVKWEPDLDGKLKVFPQVKGALTKEAGAIAGRANAMSSAFRTGLYHRDHKSPAVGNTQPKYESDQARGAVALVYTGNYAAMKDNALNNTLLKARG